MQAIRLVTLALTFAFVGAVMAADHGAQPESPDRVVAVSGRGEVTAAPDRARVSLGVEARKRDLPTARAEVEGVVTAFLDLVDRLGIARRHIRTTGLAIRPEYDWNRATQERKLTGYVVTRSIAVDLEDLELLGELLEGAAGTGINQVSQPQLYSSREDELRREALAGAARDARANAETLAGTLGARLGQVRRITTADIAAIPPPIRQMGAARAMAADTGGAAETYTAGEIRIEARVTAEFDLLN